MSFINELRKQGAQFSLLAGTVALALGIILVWFGSDWGYVIGTIGFLLVAAGIKSFMASSIVEGIPELIGAISRHTEPGWDGEMMYTDGGRYKIRFIFDGRRQPYFLANDICTAIGTRAPLRDSLQWGGARLFVQDRHLCFSRESVQAYLTPLAIKNHEANLLLTRLGNEVFRKLDKARQQA